MAKSKEDETLDYYRENAKAYAESSTQGFERDALREFSHHLPAGSTVLDAGFGAGYHLAHFLEQGFNCEGFEGSPELLELTKARLAKLFPDDPSRLKLWKADFRMLSLSPEHYDGIWANQVFTHLPPAGCQRMMQSFFSAMKPGGFLFVSFDSLGESLGDSPGAPSETFTTHEERTGDSVRHFYRYPASEFESLVRQSGFQPLSKGHDVLNPSRTAILAKRVS